MQISQNISEFSEFQNLRILIKIPENPVLLILRILILVKFKENFGIKLFRTQNCHFQYPPNSLRFMEISHHSGKSYHFAATNLRIVDFSKLSRNSSTYFFFFNEMSIFISDDESSRKGPGRRPGGEICGPI